MINLPGSGQWEVAERLVCPPRVAECPLQLEARAAAVQSDIAGEFHIVEAQVLTVHAAPETAGTVEPLDGLGNRG
ncbi:MAG TPA: hypothetical protein VGL47_41095 [Amycolatopsis sp.]|uniref:hypothetical protein n=1 Tax=Amycolatopsis sp. TaxID=37632 RepID=UPI002F3E6930